MGLNGPLPFCPGPAAIFTGRRNKDHEPCQVPRIECQQVQHWRFCSGITDGDDHRRTKRLPSTIAGPRLKRQSVGMVWIQRLYVGEFRVSVSATAMGGSNEEPSIAVVCTGRLQDVSGSGGQGAGCGLMQRKHRIGNRHKHHGPLQNNRSRKCVLFRESK